jgi:PadR family transcriptional regulator PadR
MFNEVIGDKQLAVLQIIHNQRGAAYGISIERALRKDGIPSSLPQIYAILEKLLEKKLVTRAWGDASEERGGRPKREYSITPDGIRVLFTSASVHRGPVTTGSWKPIPQ